MEVRSGAKPEAGRGHAALLLSADSRPWRGGARAAGLAPDTAIRERARNNGYAEASRAQSALPSPGGDVTVRISGAVIPLIAAASGKPALGDRLAQSRLKDKTGGVELRRRELMLLLGGATALRPLSARGQQKPMPVIGFLGNSTAALEAKLVKAFRQGLRDLGYEEGRNILIEYRWADGHYERLAPLIAELIAAKVEVFVTAGTPASLAVKKATSAIPLVMVAVGDPVGTGLVASIARPGGNATGLTSITPELEGKRLQLIKETIPTVSRVAVFWNPANAYQTADEKEVRAAAAVLGIPVLPLAVRSAEELDAAFSALLAERADAVLVLADRVFLHNRDRIVDFLVQNRLPAMNAYRELVEAGSLMSFGPSYAVMHRQAATYVDKILRGAKPEDLPVEQPAKFELVLNLKSAAALGLTVPPGIILRADEVIE